MCNSLRLFLNCFLLTNQIPLSPRDSSLLYSRVIITKSRMKTPRKKSEKAPALRSETKRGIVSIILFLFAVFFSLSLLNLAGRGGEMTKNTLVGVFGVGHFIVPLLALILSVSLAFSLKRSFSLIRWLGSFVFFFSTLALVATFSKERGGLVGNFVAEPLISFLDTGGTTALLATLVLVSLFVIFDFSFIDITNKIQNFFVLRSKKTTDPKVIDTTNTTAPLKIVGEKDDTENPAAIEAEADDERGENDEETDSKEEKLESDETKIFSITTLEPWTPPPLSLLERDSGKAGSGDVKANANVIKRTLQNFGIDVEMDEVTIGPSVTRYALKPAEGVKLSRIAALQDNLAYALAAHPIRIEAPIPGKSLVGIEIPNTTKATIGLGSILAHEDYQQTNLPLMVAVGKSITGKAQFANLAKMPHLLIAGATGSGKSVTIHAIINSLLYRNAPEALKFIMIDPKRVELTLYNGIPHLVSPVVTDAKKTIAALRWAAREMDRRYDLLEQHTVRDIQSYQTTVFTPAIEKYKAEGSDEAEVEKLPPTMPYIVIVIDELADIMATFPRELEASIVRLAQMSRAVGIHLILSTQRPSVNVITGLIKANVPARIALQVASQIDSRTILDMGGAENLLGAGDMLYLSADMSKPVRLQSAFISEKEVKSTVTYLKKAGADRLTTMIDFTDEVKGKDPIFDGTNRMDDGEDDPLYEEARSIVIQENKASTSLLQRKLSIGYGRAAKIMDILEERGIIGPSTSGSKAREVLLGQGLPEETGAETPEERNTLPPPPPLS